MSRFLSLVAVCGLALLLSTPATADAQIGRDSLIGGVGGVPFGGCGYPYAYFGLGEVYRSAIDRVPHFALFPPVYYSYPVPRPYGYSPFAYPPGHTTPEILAPAEPKIIQNRFVPSDSKSDPSDQTAQRPSAVESNASRPLVVVNPYVVGNETQIVATP